MSIAQMAKLKPVMDKWHDQELIKLIRESYVLIKGGLGLQQVLEELQNVKDYLSPRKFKKFVELGSDDGSSLWIYANLFCEPGAEIISIDYQGKLNLKDVIQALNNEGFKASLIVKHTHSKDIELDPDIDLLHIDAMHSTDAVVGDWNKYYFKVIDDGIILLHDTLLHEGPIEARRRIVKNGFRCTTFGGDITLSNETYVSAGISVVEKKYGFVVKPVL